MHHRKLLAALDGLLCVYKPSELSMAALKRLLLRKICSTGEQTIVQRELPVIQVPIVEQHPLSGSLVVVGERVQTDYAHHPLVVGEELLANDLRLEEMMYLEPSSSGVCLFGVNNFCDELPGLMSKSWLNHYRIEGMFGRETLQHEIKGKVTLRTDYDHITKYQLAKMLSRIQSQYRRTAFESANVDMQSQKAFELARKGIPRAQIPGVPIIYSIDMVSFNLPYFALHIQTGGESDRFLRCFTHELGVSLGSTACCVRLQRRSIGPFFSDAALLDKQLTLQNILRNMTVCRNLLEKTASDPDRCHEVPAPRRNTRGLVDGPGLEPQEEDDAMRPAWPRYFDS